MTVGYCFCAVYYLWLKCYGVSYWLKTDFGANWNTLMSFACSPNIPCGLRHNVKRRANRKQHVHLFQTQDKSLLRRKMCEPWVKKSRNCGKAPILQFRWLALQLDYLFLTYSAIKPKLAEITWLKVSGIKKKHTHTHAKVIVLLLNSYDVVPLSEIRNLMLCWLMNVECASQNIFFLEIRQLFWSCFDLVYIFFVSFIFTEEEGQVSAV